MLWLDWSLFFTTCARLLPATEGAGPIDQVCTACGVALFLRLSFLICKTGINNTCLGGCCGRSNEIADVEHLTQCLAQKKHWNGCEKITRSQPGLAPVERKVKALAVQSPLTQWDPMDCSPPASFVHGILQAKTVERVAIPFSRRFSGPRDQTLGLLHCRQTVYHLSHQESPGSWGPVFKRVKGVWNKGWEEERLRMRSEPRVGVGGCDFIVPEGLELVDQQERVGVGPSNCRCSDQFLGLGLSSSECPSQDDDRQGRLCGGLGTLSLCSSTHRDINQSLAFSSPHLLREESRISSAFLPGTVHGLCGKGLMNVSMCPSLHIYRMVVKKP